jgi:hypothetical protein
MDSDEKHFLIKHFSVGDIVSLVTMLFVFAVGYGRIETTVSNLTRQVEALNARDITPGAATRLAAFEAEQESLRRDMTEARTDAIEFRREIRASLERIENKLAIQPR